MPREGKRLASMYFVEIGGLGQGLGHRLRDRRSLARIKPMSLVCFLLQARDRCDRGQQLLGQLCARCSLVHGPVRVGSVVGRRWFRRRLSYPINVLRWQDSHQGCPFFSSRVRGWMRSSRWTRQPKTEANLLLLDQLDQFVLAAGPNVEISVGEQQWCPSLPRWREYGGSRMASMAAKILVVSLPLASDTLAPMETMASRGANIRKVA